ncbi:site-2 protease family protein [Candidatus Magnetobacterium casense]|uniref:site-2 protease family protein n=1 Tax=Candidatus Magnetobacterium casense TaxID=1455061 RepID=UPI000695A7F7|nr:site-2 protease family protein [Candidatus Magnetobacterium casensis]
MHSLAFVVNNVLRKLTAMHVILFFLTFVSTLIAGALQKGINPLDDPGRIYEGLPFAMTLLSILLAHELAHYLASISHDTIATLPYFIPGPSIFGTFGAFIKMKSPITTRTALIDIGASGPIAGFLVSLVAVVFGLFYSDVVEVTDGLAFELGDSLLFYLLTKIIVGTPPEGFDVLLSPVAFAGWIGFLVTSLNLLPIGQLDGGHIVYAIEKDIHTWVSRTLLVVLSVSGIWLWTGWLTWTLLLLILGIHHPPVLFSDIPLQPSRKKTALVSLSIFILTFIPQPFKMS